MNRTRFAPRLVLLATLLFAVAVPCRAADSATATYAVTFTAEWSATTHPQAFPAAAHFSSLIGATHAAGVTFWAPGQLASPGLKLVAELGNPSVLKAQLQAGVAAGQAGAIISGFGSVTSPGSTSETFVATQAFPCVTLVTMVAPSPDWFVGVRDLALRADGQWLAELVVPLFAYDAGTDSGESFSSPNLVSTPFVPVVLITEFPLDSPVPLGHFRFMRTDAPPAWSDLGGGLAAPGAGGLAATLSGSGELQAGTPVVLQLTGARADTTTTLVVGTSVLALPFKGGTLLPSPDLLMSGLLTDAAGDQSLAAVWPAGLPSGTRLLFQQWWVEPAAIAGVAASNGLCATTP